MVFAVRCPCCGLRATRSASDDAQLCSGNCAQCGGSCLGVPKREPAQSAPPLAVRPVDDANWTMRN